MHLYGADHTAAPLVLMDSSYAMVVQRAVSMVDVEVETVAATAATVAVTTASVQTKIENSINPFFQLFWLFCR